MSTAPQGQWLKGSWLEGQRLQAQRREADHALAVRDIRGPGLNWVPDDELPSEILGRALELIA
jgi:hypothetical protein